MMNTVRIMNPGELYIKASSGTEVCIYIKMRVISQHHAWILDGCWFLHLQSLLKWVYEVWLQWRPSFSNVNLIIGLLNYELQKLLWLHYGFRRALISDGPISVISQLFSQTSANFLSAYRPNTMVKKCTHTHPRYWSTVVTTTHGFTQTLEAESVLIMHSIHSWTLISYSLTFFQDVTYGHVFHPTDQRFTHLQHLMGWGQWQRMFLFLPSQMHHLSLAPSLARFCVSRPSRFGKVR